MNGVDFTFMYVGIPHYGKIRPGVERLLKNQLSKNRNLICFSAGPSKYIEAALEAAGLRKYFNKILTETDLSFDNSRYIKDISKFTKSIDDAVAIDDKQKNFPGDLQKRLVHVQPYYGIDDKDDYELEQLESSIEMKFATKQIISTVFNKTKNAKLYNFILGS